MGVASMLTVTIGPPGRRTARSAPRAQPARHFTSRGRRLPRRRSPTCCGARSTAPTPRRTTARPRCTTSSPAWPTAAASLERSSGRLERARAERCGAALLLRHRQLQGRQRQPWARRRRRAAAALAPRLLAIGPRRRHGRPPRGRRVRPRLRGDRLATSTPSRLAQRVLAALPSRRARPAQPFVKASIGVVWTTAAARPAAAARRRRRRCTRPRSGGGGGVRAVLPGHATRADGAACAPSLGSARRARARRAARALPALLSIPGRQLLGMEALVRWQHPGAVSSPRASSSRWPSRPDRSCARRPGCSMPPPGDGALRARWRWPTR